MIERESLDGENNTGFLSGHFLLAMPHMDDPTFQKALVYLFEHSEEGALGFVLNKPCEGLSLNEVFKNLEIETVESTQQQLTNSNPVRLGGPCNRDHGFVLHRSASLLSGSKAGALGLGVTSAIDALKSIGAGDFDDDFIFLLGFAGWGPGQLEDEIRDNVWLSAPSDEDLLFSPDLENNWELGLERIGVTPAQLAAFAGSA